MRKLSVVWNTAFRWICGINRYVHMRQYLKHCGTVSFAFLVDMRFLMFMFKLHEHLTELLNRLVKRFNTMLEMKEVLCKYTLWLGSNESEIKCVVNNAFDTHCEMLEVSE